MASQFLNHLNLDERGALTNQLHDTQGGHCFMDVLAKPINLIDTSK